MSRVIIEAPIISPLGVLTGDTVNDTGMPVPSFFLRMVSKIPHRFSRFDFPEEIRHFAYTVRWREDRRRSAFNFLFRIPIHPLGRGVPAFNNAVKRLAENSVVRILNDGRKAGVGLLGAFPRGYFQHGDQEFCQGAGVIRERRADQLRMKINAAFVFKPDFACFGNVFMKTSQMQQENIYIFGMDKGIENLAGKIVFSTPRISAAVTLASMIFPVFSVVIYPTARKLYRSENLFFEFSIMVCACRRFSF